MVVITNLRVLLVVALSRGRLSSQHRAVRRTSVIRFNALLLLVTLSQRRPPIRRRAARRILVIKCKQDGFGDTNAATGRGGAELDRSPLFEETTCSSSYLEVDGAARA